jgi:hypothetical protein
LVAPCVVGVSAEFGRCAADALAWLQRGRAEFAKARTVRHLFLIDAARLASRWIDNRAGRNHALAESHLVAQVLRYHEAVLTRTLPGDVDRRRRRDDVANDHE